MSDHETEKDLSAFEARLAALQPRKPVGWALPTTKCFEGGGPCPPYVCRANPEGHHFVCLHCGIEAPLRGRRSLWRSPRVYVAAVTAGLAAAVLLMFARSPNNQVGGNGDAAACVQDDALFSAGLQASALRHGIDWNDRRPSHGLAGAISADKPATNRELLQRFLAEPAGS